MLTIIFLVFAAICNAVMDKVSHHYFTSIFSKFNNPKFWDAGESWKNKYIDGDFTKGRRKWLFGMNVPVQVTDAWHLFKTFMIIGICSSIIVYDPGIHPLVDLLILGIVWNSTFSLFYNKIFSK